MTVILFGEVPGHKLSPGQLHDKRPRETAGAFLYLGGGGNKSAEHDRQREPIQYGLAGCGLDSRHDSFLHRSSRFGFIGHGHSLPSGTQGIWFREVSFWLIQVIQKSRQAAGFLTGNPAFLRLSGSRPQ